MGYICILTSDSLPKISCMDRNIYSVYAITSGDYGLKAGQASYVYKWIAQCGSKVLDRIVISEIVVCNILLPNIQIWRKPFITGKNDFRRDPSRRMSQIRLKLASTANAPRSLCTCGSQIMQFDCMIIQSADSECCHSVWLCYMRGLSPDQT